MFKISDIVDFIYCGVEGVGEIVGVDSIGRKVIKVINTNKELAETEIAVWDAFLAKSATTEIIKPTIAQTKDEILKLLQTGDVYSIDLAIQQMVECNLRDYFEARYKELTELCKCSLKELFLKTNLGLSHFKTLPSTVFTLVKLRALHLTNGNLVEISGDIGNLVNLKILNLSTNKLTKLPKDIGSLVKLEHLCLDNNKLSELPITIGKLTNLVELHLNNNQLTKLPKDIGSLVNLKDLLLRTNLLTSLPIEIGQLENLCYLKLENNKIEQLPTSFCELRSLRWLNVCKNPLNGLPNNFHKLNSLSAFFVDSNVNIGKDFHQMLPNCKTFHHS